MHILVADPVHPRYTPGPPQHFPFCGIVYKNQMQIVSVHTVFCIAQVVDTEGVNPNWFAPMEISDFMRLLTYYSFPDFQGMRCKFNSSIRCALCNIFVLTERHKNRHESGIFVIRRMILKSQVSQVLIPCIRCDPPLIPKPVRFLDVYTHIHIHKIPIHVIHGIHIISLNMYIYTY